jgi:FkbM family methyltransferase
MIVNYILILILIIIYSVFYKMYNKKYKTKQFISIFFLTLIFILIYNYNIVKECTEVNNQYREVNNPYTYNNTTLKWPLFSDTYLINNWPNTFDFDSDIKKHIVKNSVNLPKGYSIIDCGAHIGDGAIPIADALRYNNRMDIKVYALDPSLEKCEFIKKIAKLNNLYNVIVLQTGLSDKEKTYKANKKWYQFTNTGATYWTETCNEETDDYLEKIRFTTLDLLVDGGYISEKIGYIHLDVEDMESKAIIGALRTIKKSKPILSLEEHKVNDNTLKNILYPLGYRFDRRLGSNNIYI